MIKKDLLANGRLSRIVLTPYRNKFIKVKSFNLMAEQKYIFCN